METNLPAKRPPLTVMGQAEGEMRRRITHPGGRSLRSGAASGLSAMSSSIMASVGINWETFRTHGAATVYGEERPGFPGREAGTACCAPAEVATPAPARACC